MQFVYLFFDDAFFTEPFYQALAAFENITVSTLEIARIPRVGNIADIVGKIKQAADSIVMLSRGNPLHIADILGIHTDKKIKFLKVGARHLSCSF